MNSPALLAVPRSLLRLLLASSSWLRLTALPLLDRLSTPTEVLLSAVKCVLHMNLAQRLLRRTEASRYVHEEKQTALCYDIVLMSL